jgi:hypothetical protein
MAVAGRLNLRTGRIAPILFVVMAARTKVNGKSNATKARSKAAC